MDYERTGNLIQKLRKEKNMTQVQLAGLITFYSDCYYDHRSDKYYKLNWMEDPYRKMTGLCEDLLNDESYEYTGDIHFENQGSTLDVKCTLTEKPMELIVDYYRQLIDEPRDDEIMEIQDRYVCMIGQVEP